MGRTHRLPGRIWLFAIAAAFALVGAQSIHPRELYDQMYPIEALKRDAFHICNEANPAFIRAVGADREACFNSMPHIIAVALGRVRRPDLSELATLDPPHQVELLMTLAAMPPRQPITAPRSFQNTSWMRALARPCADKTDAPRVSNVEPAVPPRLPQDAGAVLDRAVLDRAALDRAALDKAVPGNLPALARGGKGIAAPQRDVPVIPLAGRDATPAPSPSATGKDEAAGLFAPLPTPDVGDREAPAIVPLAPATACGA